MKIPFTVEQFFDVFVNYNHAIWPAQVVAYAIGLMVIYPLLGLGFGHSYPKAPMFGVAPCPTKIFTFGLLLWTIGPVPAYLLIIPLVWSLIGMSAAVNLSVPQDYGLVIAGALGTVLILIHNRRIKHSI